MDWIERDQSPSQKPSKFVIGHEPAYPQFRRAGDSLDADPLMRDDFWQILSENNVTAFISGHTHYIYKEILTLVFFLVFILIVFHKSMNCGSYPH
ncbi:MAG: metallophosphoesterase [Deltaproteobacteria bacterium]|nr:metallophosphoesterase [Deltaproteobacteria bacterium]